MPHRENTRAVGQYASPPPRVQGPMASAAMPHASWPASRGARTAGLAFLLVTCVCWTAASYITQAWGASSVPGGLGA